MASYGKRWPTVKETYSDVKKQLKEFKTAPVASLEANNPIGLNRSCKSRGNDRDQG